MYSVHRRHASPAAWILATALALVTAQVHAHAKLVSADPAPDSTVAAPKNITLKFNEAITKNFSSFKVSDGAGQQVSLMPMKSPDAQSLTAMPNAGLAPGLYTVSWTAVSSDDGHKMTGTYRFTVK
jgi:copper resistance protein C